MVQRSVSSSFNIRLGLFNVPVELAPIRKPNTRNGADTKLTNICPHCNSALGQRYACPEHGNFLISETAKARKTKAGLIPIPPEELVTLEDPRAPGLMEIKVCPADQILGATHPDGNAYRIRPAEVTPPGFFAALTEAAKDPQRVLYGVARLSMRSSSQPFLITMARGQLVLQQIVAPADLAENDDLGSVTVSPEYASMVKQLVTNMTQDFDPSTFEDDKAEKLAAIVESHKDEIITTPAPSAAPTDLLTALEAALAQFGTQEVSPTKTRRSANGKRSGTLASYPRAS